MDYNFSFKKGCTPLHISAQQGHEEVFDLLIKTYGKLNCTNRVILKTKIKLLPIGADSNLRDYSGKKPYQYLPRRDSVISSDTFRSEYSGRPNKFSSGPSSFERGGGIYSSIRNSLFKLNNTQPESFVMRDEAGSSTTLPSRPVSHSALSSVPTGGQFLRELRPSVRRRANSASAFVNNTT